MTPGETDTYRVLTLGAPSQAERRQRAYGAKDICRDDGSDFARLDVGAEEF